MEIITNRVEMLNLIPKNGVVCEIGVFKGEFSEKIIQVLNPSKIYLVDIFEGIMCSGDKDGLNIVHTDLSLEYTSLVYKYSNDQRVKLIKSRSDEFMESMPNDYFDYIYIDGDHSYEGVSSDLNLSIKKVKSGGFISGHDYTSMFPGVVMAVDEFCFKNNLEIKYITGDGCPSFLIKKI